MRFVLHYRGPLRANGRPEHKNEIRQAIHSQLARLWRQEPLSGYPNLLEPRKREGNYCLLRPFGPFTFVPLVNAEMNVIAELRVTLLRPETPGHLITQGGDIDNRLKTLFDALTMPRHTDQLPAGAAPTADQVPFFCLLEDDNLVTAVAIRTEQLLEPAGDPSTVDLTVDVETRVTRPTVSNGVFGW